MSELDSLSEEEIIERATTLGYKDEKDWKGAPPAGGFVDAKTFLKKAEDALPVLRANNERLHSEIREMRKTFEDFSAYHKQTVEKTEKQAFEKAKAQILEAQKEAIKTGDADAFVTARKQEEEIQRQEQEYFANKQKPTVNNVEAVRLEWEKQNPWFNDDFELYHTAKEAAEFLAKKGVEDPKKFLDDMKGLVMKKHPDHPAFADAPMPFASDNGQRQISNSGRKPASSYEALPPEAKETCDRYVKQGLLTKEQYVKEYFA